MKLSKQQQRRLRDLRRWIPDADKSMVYTRTQHFVSGLLHALAALALIAGMVTLYALAAVLGH